MELSGHSGEVFCAKFDPNGNYIASGSMDRSISEFIYGLEILRTKANNYVQCCGEHMVAVRTMGF